MATCILCDRLFDNARKHATKTTCHPCIKKRHQVAVKANLVDYKGNKCQLCGYDNCFSALDFHHVDATEKETELSKMTSLSQKSQETEVRKCLLLCSNCHRKLHAAIRDVEKNHPPSPIIEIANQTHEKWLATAGSLPPRKHWKDYHHKYNKQECRIDYSSINGLLSGLI